MNYDFGTVCGILFVIVFLTALITKFINNKRNKNKQGLYKSKIFLTQNEKDCFNHLRKILPEYIICPQVSMGAVLTPSISSTDEKSQKDAFILRNKIGSKIIDFVLLDKDTFEIKFIIELDDKSHDNKKEQDTIRDQHLFLAGIPTVRFRRENGKFPDKKMILSMIKN